MFSTSSQNLLDRSDIRKILVIRWSALGDVALSSAGFEELYRAFPKAELHLSTLPPCDKLFEADPRFKRIWATPLRDRRRQWRLMAQWIMKIRREHYDLIVDFQCTDRVRLLLVVLWLLGAAGRYRVGNAPAFPYSIAPRRIPEPVNALTRIRRVLISIGIEPSVDRPVLFPGAKDIAAAREKLTRLGLQSGRYAVLLPGSQAAGYLKRWGAERFVKLVQVLSLNSPSSMCSHNGDPNNASLHKTDSRAHADIEGFLILGGPDEIDECLRISDLAREKVHNLCCETSLLEIIPLCQGARFVIANDTGTAHIAATTGRPMLVICGPTDPRMVLPAGPRVQFMQADLDCINCYQKHCDHHSCMRLITAGDVAARLRQMDVWAVST